jgi:hypothetical protein
MSDNPGAMEQMSGSRILQHRGSRLAVKEIASVVRHSFNRRPSVTRGYGMYLKGPRLQGRNARATDKSSRSGQEHSLGHVHLSA